jgi:ABC-2 type transport system permease protein
MNGYASVWKLRLINGLQYRTAAFAGVATQLFFGFIFIMVFAAFYSNSTSEPPMSLKEIVTYVWLQQMFLSFIMLWIRDPELAELITSGNIAYELCRPCDLYWFWYSKLLAQRLASAMLRSFPILTVIFFLPEPYRMSLPKSPAAFLLFLISLSLGLLVIVAISMLIYISMFWTLSPTGSILMVSIAGDFLAGSVIPVPLMPQWMQQVTFWFPFRWTADFPFRVYSGHIPADEAFWGIGVQLVWLILLIIMGKWCFKTALKRVVVQGG